jgi:hypothetical protein
MRPKAAHSMMHSGRSTHAQKRRKRGKRRQVGMTIGHHTHLGAGRPLEHPGWNLKPTVGIGTAQITAKNNSVRLLDSFVNADPKSKPRVPWVQQFPKLSSVGVPKPCCTTRSNHTARSATKSRSSSSTDQRHSARPDRATLEKAQHGGPTMGSGSLMSNTYLKSDRFQGVDQHR